MDDFIARVRECIETYGMMGPQDRIVCAASGGKDSSALLLSLSTLFPGSVTALTFDPHIPEYSDTNIANLKTLCKQLGVPLTTISLSELHDVTLFELKERLGEKAQTYCAICGVLKRYYLNHFARKEGATVIATGHNRDDIVQSHLMNILRGNPAASARLGPVSGVTRDTRFIPRVKPLIWISEKEILDYTEEKRLPVDTSPCPYSQEAYRRTLKNALSEYEEASPGMHKRVLERFLADLDALKEHFSSQETPGTCGICGEPCQQDICTACRLLRKADLI